MGTPAGSNTRRYHGLLVAPVQASGERAVLLSRVEEQILVDGQWVELGCCQYPGIVQPAGHLHLTEFSSRLAPSWQWQVGETTLRRRLDLFARPHRANLTYLANKPLQMRWRPFFAMRPYHSLREADGWLDSWGNEDALTVSSEALAAKLHIIAPTATWHQQPNWYHDVEYLEELDRGFPFRESLFSPGWFQLQLSANQPWAVSASLDRPEPPRLADLAPAATENQTQLMAASSEAFLFTRADGEPSIMAGYPWFTDWGRDTMIAIPGLLLVDGKVSQAKAIVEGFLRYEKDGLLPNRFPDRNAEPEYNTADATLWSFVVAGELFDMGEADWVRQEFLPVAKRIILAHMQGTRFAIGVDPADGLLHAGTPETQLTWMDARCNGQPVTPRHGKAVELNALWANALFRMQQFSSASGDSWQADAAASALSRLQLSFGKTFWDPSRGICRDMANDNAFRPNQLLATSLPVQLLPVDQAQLLLRNVRQQLLTPAGLRTLAINEPGFIPRYEGSPEQRDSAYHQGTVWPWLLEPFWKGWLQQVGPGPETDALAAAFLQSVPRLLQDRCLGHVAEIYDATDPQLPKGAPAQAWSLAALRSVSKLLAGA